MSLFQYIAQACQSLAVAAAPSITAVGIHMVLALATIMLVWFGVQEALSSAQGGPGFSMGGPMNRLLFVAVVGVAFLPAWGAQDGPGGTLPPGPAGGPAEVVHALLVQAQMLEDGQVMFLYPRGDQVPSVTAKVDGKDVRALGTDRKPLAGAELEKRLAGWTAVVVGQAEFEVPDAHFLKVLHERSVSFVFPKKIFAPMAKASEERLAPGKVRP